jgi:GT2 family glycosyltransferase
MVFIEYFKWVLGQFGAGNLYSVFFWGGKRKPIWYMRNELIKKAMAVKDCTHILFIDTDVIPQDGFMEKMKEYAKTADIVSGVYYHMDGTPNSRKAEFPYQGKGLEEVDMCAMGASLISRSVCEKVAYPEPNNVTIDADIEFCRKIKQAGFKVQQDFDLKCVHLLTVPVMY